MSKQNWKPINTRALLNNLNLVLKTGDINKLNKPTYTHISLMSGFIAHYDLHGFRGYYECTSDLIRDLANSADFRNPEREIRDPWFAKEYGKEYCQSKANFYNGVVTLITLYNSQKGG